MSVEILPITADVSNFSEEITLENVPFRFDFVFNNRSNQWSMSVLNINLTPIVEGIKLVLNYGMFEQFRSYDLPPGELYAIDSTGDEIEITRTNLGNTVLLIYILEDQVTPLASISGASALL